MATGAGEPVTQECTGDSQPSQERPRPWSAGATGRRSPRLHGDAFEGQEAARRRVDWELEIESLGRRETELHRTQLRLVREQAAAFLRDLKTLQEEVVTLRSRQDSLHQDCTAAWELRTREFRDALETERGERESVNLALSQRLLGLEKELPECRDDVAVLRKQVRSVGGNVSAPLQELKEGLSAETAERAALATRLQRRCDELADLSAKGADDAAELHRALKSQRTASEKEQSAFDERLSSLGDGLRSVQAQQAGFESTLRQANADMEVSISTHAQRLGAESLERTSAQDRLSHLEKLLREACSKHVADLEVAQSKVEQAHSRIAACESYGPLLDELSLAQSGFTAAKAALAAQHAAMNDRVDRLDTLLAESVGRLSPLHERLSACEDHGKSLSVLESSVENLLELCGKTDLSKHEALMKEHVEHLENLTQTYDEHAKELKAIKGTTDLQYTGLKDRFDNLESALEEFSGAHDRDLTALRKALAKHAKELDSAKEALDGLEAGGKREVRQESVEEHLLILEASLRETSSQRAEDITDVHAELERIRGRLAACEAHESVLTELQDARASFSESLAAQEARHSSAQDRLDGFAIETEGLASRLASLHSGVNDLEKSLADSVERQSTDVEALQAVHARHNKALEAVRKAHGLVEGRVDACAARTVTLEDRLQALGEESTSKQCALQAQLRHLEDSLGEVAQRQTIDVEALQAVHSRHNKAVEDVRKAHGLVEGRVDACEARAVTLEDRLHALGEESTSKQCALQAQLRHLEDSLGEVAQRHAAVTESAREAHARHFEELETIRKASSTHVRDVAVVRSSVEELRSELAGERAAREAASREAAASDARELAVAREAVEELRGCLLAEAKVAEERIGLIDAKLCKVTQRQATEVAALQAKQDASDKDLHSVSAKFSGFELRHANVQDRLGALEKGFADSMARQTQELQALQDAHAAISSETMERHSRLVVVVDQDREARDAFGRSLQERFCSIEALQRNTVVTQQEHSQALESLRAEHANITSDVKLLASRHGSMMERLDRFAVDSEASAAQHISVRQRVDRLERAVDEVADRQSRDMESSRTTHFKHAKELEALEVALRDVTAGHSKELKLKSTEVEQFRISLADERVAREERFCSIEAFQRNTVATQQEYSQALESLRAELANITSDAKLLASRHGSMTDRLDRLAVESEAAVAQHISVRQRVEQLERAVDDVADRQSRDMEASRTTHFKHAKELEALEAIMRDAADKHAIDVGSARAHLEKLEVLLADDRAAHQVALRDVAVGHSKELKSAVAEVEQLRISLADERVAREVLRGGLTEERVALEARHTTACELLASERAARDAQHAAVQRRVCQLEELLCGQCKAGGDERPLARVAALADRAQGGIVGPVIERLEALQVAIGSCEEQRKQEQKATRAKILEMQGVLARIKEAWHGDAEGFWATGGG